LQDIADKMEQMDNKIEMLLESNEEVKNKLDAVIAK
jgi:hypothetical protein